MDNYEKLLEAKIEDAKKDLNVNYGRQDGKSMTHFVEKVRLTGEIEAYQDALNEYRQMKAKKEVGWC